MSFSITCIENQNMFPRYTQEYLFFINITQRAKLSIFFVPKSQPQSQNMLYFKYTLPHFLQFSLYLFNILCFALSKHTSLCIECERQVIYKGCISKTAQTQHSHCNFHCGSIFKLQSGGAGFQLNCLNFLEVLEIFRASATLHHSLQTNFVFIFQPMSV